MSGVALVLGGAACMLVGSVGAGITPFFVSASERKIEAITVLGSGMLMGTALAVVFPEGAFCCGLGPVLFSLPTSHFPLLLLLPLVVPFLSGSSLVLMRVIFVPANH
jgi:hypothetical protein